MGWRESTENQRDLLEELREFSRSLTLEESDRLQQLMGKDPELSIECRVLLKMLVDTLVERLIEERTRRRKRRLRLDHDQES